MSVLISCQSLTKSYRIRPLFHNISLGVEDGERMGLIGPNGAGKSTLLKILAGQETPDGGAVSIRRNLKLGYVPQEEAFAAGLTVNAALREALSGAHLEDAEADAQVAAMVGRMEFADPEQLAQTLSGGWRKRLALARELIKEPDLLLLDEPTNHLDLEGVLWLEALLKDAAFAFVVVSHDRAFLESVTNRTVELNPLYAEGFLSAAGPYSEFLGKREEYFAAQAHQEVTLKGQVKKEIEWLRRGAKARSTKAQARIDSAGRLIDQLSDVKSRNNTAGIRVGVDWNSSGRKTKDLVQAQGIGKTLGGRVLFRDLDVILSPKQKLGLIGPNGSGKSTLLRLLTGETMPDKGEIRRADGLRIVFFDQSRAGLDKSVSLRRALAPEGDTVTFKNSVMHVSAWAKRFGFLPEQLEVPLSVCSGGEQARVLIANLMLRPADLLILDEPTNDLDIPTLEVLEESLQEFPGALVLVTHDRYLLDQIATEILALDGKGEARAFADLSQWQDWFRDAKTPASPVSKPVVAAKNSDNAARLSTAERREWKNIEGQIEAAEQKVADLETLLHDPAVASDHLRLQETWDALADAKAAVTSLYARWEELDARQNV